MVVTELAILKLQQDHSPAALSSAIKDVFPIQDDWVAKHQLAIRRTGRPQTDAYIDTNTVLSTAIYLIAPWASPEGHWEWIRTEENGKANAVLTPFLATGRNAVLLFHLEPAGKVRDFTSLSFPVSMTITRISVKSNYKPTLQAAYQAAEDKLIGSRSLWAGWRIEKQDDLEELVIIWAGPDVGQTVGSLEQLGDSSETHALDLLQ